MAYLFKVEGKAVFPTEEVLLIPPFSEIWNRDKSKDKRTAMQEFAFIEFVGSMKKTNPYKGYDSSLRARKVAEDIVTVKGWEPDEKVIEGVKRIDEFQKNASATYSFFKSVKKAAENLKSFFNSVDLTMTNLKTGNPMYKPADITRAISDAEKILNSLKSLETKVEEELYEETKTKGNKEISPFANPDSI